MTKSFSRNFLAGALILAVPAFPSAASAQPPAAPPAAAPRPAIAFDAAAFAAYVEQERQKWNVPGMAVAVVRRDEVLLLQGYGVRQVGRAPAVDARTVFNTGSVTKSFTAALLAQLAAERKLALADPVARHLPGLLQGAYADDVTLTDLLSHRSGIGPANYSILGDIGRDEALRRFQHLPRVSPPRTAFLYNNFGYVAAAAAAERATGASWDQLIRQQFFTPMGLTDAVTSTAEELAAANRAAPHGMIGERVTSVAPVPLRMVGPAGTIGMSIRDLSKWVQLHLNEGKLGDRQVLAPEAVRMMQAPHIWQAVSPALRQTWPSTHFRAYGLGWFMRDYRGVKLLEHGGNTTGYSAHVAFVPELDFGIAILTNMSNSPLPTALLYRAVDAALGEPVRDWSAEFLAANASARPPAAAARPTLTPSLPLAAYLGTYRSPLYGEVRVTRSGERLVLHITDQLTGEMTARGENRFSASWRDPYMAAVGADGPFLFEMGADGRPQALVFEIPGERVVYSRVAEAPPGAR